MNSNYHCYVTIVNNTEQPMYLSGANPPVPVHGSYVTNPPAEIGAMKSASFTMKDGIVLGVGYGPEGNCTYQLTTPNGATAVLNFKYCCAHFGNNFADVVLNDYSNELRVNMVPNPIPKGGHPVHVMFIVEQI